MKRVIALGFFDGIHIGHSSLLQCAVKRAQALNAVSTAVTFDAHPDTLVTGAKVPLINTAEDRVYLMKRMFSIQEVIFLRFDRAMMELTWEKFVNYLKNELGAVHLVIGHDFSCGWHGEGTVERLSAWCKENDIGIDIIPKIELHGDTVSSTRIRNLLCAGCLGQANQLLGHPHMLSGTVRVGARFGRAIGQLNVHLCVRPEILIPHPGVYTAMAYFDGIKKPAVVHIGERQTPTGRTVVADGHLLWFYGNLYGKQIRLELLSFRRPQHRFADMAALRMQVMRDTADAIEYFTGHGLDQPRRESIENSRLRIWKADTPLVQGGLST